MYRIVFFWMIFLLFSCQKSNRQEYKFRDSSHINIDTCNAQTINKLVQLCKIWGYLKYYHPTVASGKYNWDFELFRIMSLVLNAHSQKDNENIIYGWIKSLGDITSSETHNSFDSVNTAIYPDISWIEDSISLGVITGQLITVKHAKRDNVQHYVKLGTAGNAEFINEAIYSQFHFPDTGYRLLALFRYWNIIQYFYPYRKMIDDDWNDVLIRFIPLIINASNRKDYVKVLHKLFACIHDAHAYLGDALNNEIKYKIPIDVSFIEGKVVVTNGNLGISQLTRGDIILKIEGKTIEEIAAERLPYLSASNYPTKLRELASELLVSNKDRLYIDYERNGEQQSDFIMCTNCDSKYNSRYQQNKPLVSYFSKGSILYLYLGSKQGGVIPKNITEKGVIIDLRCYPSNKVKGYWDIRQFYSDKTEFVKFSTPSIISPGLFNFSKPLTVGEKNKNYYKGKKVILINELTQSQAEFLVMKYRCAPNSIVIGQTTAGTDGDVSLFALPGGIYTGISGIGVYYPDGRCTQRVGIIPDIEIVPRVENIREGKDTLLHKAIEIIENS